MLEPKAKKNHYSVEKVVVKKARRFLFITIRKEQVEYRIKTSGGTESRPTEAEARNRARSLNFYDIAVEFRIGRDGNGVYWVYRKEWPHTGVKYSTRDENGVPYYKVTECKLLNSKDDNLKLEKGFNLQTDAREMLKRVEEAIEKEVASKRITIL